MEQILINKIQTKKMKKLSIIIAIFISTSIFSQNISLESYKFGEGLQFNADRGHSIRLTGYAQPMIDLKNYTDVEENSSTSRYRIRRLRLRIDGKSKNQKFGYRFQADLSGTSETGEDTGDSEYADLQRKFHSRNRSDYGTGQGFDGECAGRGRTCYLPQSGRASTILMW